ncbi:carboxypeptidase regulatory-like domain-containing protein [Vitiosangium sp. GDMCC 1.1324]|uniref:carboxypeptidase regulatory-like domain-containing protein n=1 Tax=Vitiosangium sp. (strain GDMCC 1.1324) TaxID=2138576 RepID=UPI000D396BD8|nr:carboxypeptidase regulatory-like domain-containing protein [Vitiosangium sp. GDMCC 1.1324]PTL75268.1 TonB-dependent receptor [Vitiosangium sp. GDMCC 1.1324]
MKLRTLGLSVLGAMGLCALSACKKDEAAPAPAQAPAPAAPTVKAAPLPADTPLPQDSEEAAQAPKGGGSVHGFVTFKGTPPAPSPIIPGTDPNCEGMDLVDQPVQVKAGKLANVLVRVQGNVPGAPTTPPSTMVVVDQNRCTYQPRVQGAVAGQPLVLMNSDGTLHNVRGMSGGKQLFNVTQPPLKTKEAQPPKDADVIRLKCDIHPWMTAFVVMSPHPYFATSGEDGAFTLQGVPPGTYTLEAWHETLGTKTAQVTVKEGQDTEVSFEFVAAK